MFRTVFFTTILFMFGCQKRSELKYETRALDCLQVLMKNKAQGTEEKTLSLLNKYSEEFKFAADLKSNHTDRMAIANASKIANSGKLTEAKNLIEEQVVKRGYSETLEQSLNNIDKALRVQKYINTSKKLGISERSREFSQLKAHTLADYKNVSEYTSWIQEEESNIKKIANIDKNKILRSLKFAADYISLSKPELLEVILLETAVHEDSAIIPGVTNETLPDLQSSKELKNLGTQKTINASYQSRHKNFTSAQNEGIDTLQSQMVYTHLLAKGGQISKTLESLQELYDMCEIDVKFRRTILKELFLSKGWNDASLINRDFLDLSYLLETVYKSNQ